VNEVIDYSQITKRLSEKRSLQGIQGRMGSGKEQSLSLNIAHSAPSKERFNI